MHILFINPPNQLFEDILSQEAGTDKPGPPLGVLYLSSLAKQVHESIQCSLLDLQLQLSKGAREYPNIESFVINEMTNASISEVDICAITLSFNTNGESYPYITAIAKKLWPNCKIIIGGPIVTGDPSLFKEDQNLDYICLGEGEISFTQFVKQTHQNFPIDIVGIYSRRDIEDASCSLQNSPQVLDVNTLPFPDYSLVLPNAASYQYGILTSRGCPNRCAYCSHSLISGKRMRFRDIHLVLQEIEYLYTTLGARYLAVFDSNVGLNKKPFLELLSGVQKIASDLELSFNPEITHLTEESLRAYRDHGLKLLVVSIESGSPYVLTHLMLRRNYLDKARNLVQFAREIGIDVRCLFVLGMHGETPEMRQETLDYAKSLAANWCTFYIATPVPGSKLYNDLKSEGHIRVHNPTDLSRIKFRNRTFDLPKMSAAETIEFQDDMEGQVNFLDSFNIKHGHLDVAMTNFKGIASRFPHRMRAQLMILFLCHKEFSRTNDPYWKQQFENQQAIIQSLLATNKLAVQEYERYKSKPLYSHLFELFEGIAA